MDEALEGDFIARVGDEFQVGGGVLDVRLFKEADAAGDGEWNLLPGEFELQFQRVKVGAVEHGDLVEAGAFFAEFKGALGDEGGLLGGIGAGDEGGFHAGLARRREFLGKLVHVGTDGGVGHAQDFGCAAVVGLNFKDFGAGIAFGEIQDIGEVRSAPGVDALGVVAHNHDVLMTGGEEVDEIALKFICVLVFVHEDELETALILFANVLVVLQELEPEGEQVVEVHGVGGAFAVGVLLGEFRDGGGKLREITELAREQFVGALMGIGGEGKDFVEHIGLGEVGAFGVDLGVGDAGFDEVAGVIAVEDGKIAIVTEGFGVEAKDAGANGMKSAAPEGTEFVAEEVGNAAHHFGSGFVGEGEQQDSFRGDALFEKEGDAIGEGAGLAGPGAGNDEGGAWRGGDGGELLFVQFARIVNVQPDFG